jgi:hypothetical protein
MSDKYSYGRYTVIRAAANPSRDEWTNVGLIVFNEGGDRVYYKVDFTRAFARGDMRPELAESYGNCYSRLDHIGQLERTLQGTGHAMSCIQLREPLPTAVLGERYYDELFDHFVTGLDRDEIAAKYRPGP